MKDIKKIRKEIDKLDEEFLDIVSKRFELSKKVAEYKYKNSMRIFDNGREKEIIKKGMDKLKKQGFEDAKFIKKLFKIIIKKSRKIQRQVIKELRKSKVKL